MKAESGEIRKIPSAPTRMLILLGCVTGPNVEVVIAGDPLGEDPLLFHCSRPKKDKQ